MDTIWLYDSGMEFIKGLALDQKIQLQAKNKVTIMRPSMIMSIKRV
jgi:hypothetical protein